VTVRDELRTHAKSGLGRLGGRAPIRILEEAFNRWEFSGFPENPDSGAWKALRRRDDRRGCRIARCSSVLEQRPADHGDVRSRRSNKAARKAFCKDG